MIRIISRSLTALLALLFFVTPTVADQIGTAQFSNDQGFARVFSLVDIKIQFAQHPVYQPLATILHEIVGPGDVGRTFSVSSGAQFETASALLTNGSDDVMAFLTGPGGEGGFGGFRFESAHFFGNSGRIDFAGFQITSLDFRLDGFVLNTPGRNPNGDGIWTDFTVSGTMTVNGTTAVPEPATVALLAIGLAGLASKARRKT